MIPPGPPELIKVADAVVCAIRDLWRPSGNDAVERVYLPDTEDAATLAGRRVWVFPMGKGQLDIADRETDALIHRVGVVITERCEPSDWPPDKDWCDRRLAFVDALWTRLGDARDPDLFPKALAHLYPEEAEMPVAFDPDTLRSKRLYWALIELGYRGDE